MSLECIGISFVSSKRTAWWVSNLGVSSGVRLLRFKAWFYHLLFINCMTLSRFLLSLLVSSSTKYAFIKETVIENPHGTRHCSEYFRYTEERRQKCFPRIYISIGGQTLYPQHRIVALYEWMFDLLYCPSRSPAPSSQEGKKWDTCLSFDYLVYGWCYYCGLVLFL